ncbi:hypothetical protein GCM10023115_53550 [Pontixanthobacter gangjinensis]
MILVSVFGLMVLLLEPEVDLSILDDGFDLSVLDPTVFCEVLTPVGLWETCLLLLGFSILEDLPLELVLLLFRSL